MLLEGNANACLHSFVQIAEEHFFGERKISASGSSSWMKNVSALLGVLLLKVVLHISRAKFNTTNSGILYDIFYKIV